MTDYFLLAIRWTHAIAAVAWVGGGIFYFVVLRPALSDGERSSTLAARVSAEFGQLVTLAMWTLAVTGGILAVSRLSEPTATVPYGVVLGVKIALSAWMFFIVVNRRRAARHNVSPSTGGVRRALAALTNVNMTVILGVLVFLLSDILRFLVERTLAQ